ncbi:MAG: Fic family protein [Alphaproteobacteria bacterium]|nr:Fic family protein [Alphaproteobacteria bacterium]MBU2082745.1 Fic family protein [Alphaproteobacteria bacterium]MBU2143358.1 Fic family protein [Alphaproteobacteria bacterium]MBU2196799.1 Fic family protein [Alphaproteobacteria bacterium]
MLWPTVEEIIEHNECAVAITGEPHQLRDRSTLESAVFGLHQKQFYLSDEFGDDRTAVISVAAELCVTLSKRQCFLQGNKRTAALTLIQMIEMNGFEFTMGNDGDLAEIILSAALGLSNADDISSSIDPFVSPLSDSW